VRVFPVEKLPVLMMQVTQPVEVEVSQRYPTSSASPPEPFVIFSPLRNVPVDAPATGTCQLDGPLAHHQALVPELEKGKVSVKGSEAPPHLSFVAVPVVSLVDPSLLALYVQPAAFMARVKYQMTLNILPSVTFRFVIYLFAIIYPYEKVVMSALCKQLIFPPVVLIV
jgi:hypothetical protein